MKFLATLNEIVAHSKRFLVSIRHDHKISHILVNTIYVADVWFQGNITPHYAVSDTINSQNESQTNNKFR